MKNDEQDIPRHIGFIMDGNRRWAKRAGKTTMEGHFAGQKTLRDVVYHAVERGVKYISAYAFSTENWSRSQEEVGYLMGQVAKALEKYGEELADNGVRVLVLGARDNLPSPVKKSIEVIEKNTRHGETATFAICFNYGGHAEITNAVKSIVSQGIPGDDITPELISRNLYAPEVPPMDLIIRTSGEQRLSNFMLWRAAYSELIFRKEHWPDFTVDALDECLLEYSQRQRRYGG